MKKGAWEEQGREDFFFFSFPPPLFAAYSCRQSSGSWLEGCGECAGVSEEAARCQTHRGGGKWRDCYRDCVGYRLYGMRRLVLEQRGWDGLAEMPISG